MKRQWLRGALAVVATTALLAGCGGQGAGDPNTPGPGSASSQTSGGGATTTDGEQVTLTYATWSEDQKPAMQQIADAFHEQHPNITIEVQALPWPEFWTKLQVGMEGGTAPDSFWMLADRYQPYADAGMLLEMDDAIKQAGVDVSKYPQAIVDMYTRDGKLWGLPKDFDTNGLWYNKEIFDAAGVAYPDETWTWQDMREVAKQLTDAEQGIYGIAAPIDRQSGYYNTILQAGGQILSEDKKTALYDSPEAIRGLQIWVDIMQDGSSPSLLQMSDTEPVTMFMQGKLAMYQSGAYWAKRFYDDAEFWPKVGVAVLPQDKQRATVTSGILNAGYADSAHPEELQQWLIFLGGQEAAEIQGRTGAVLPAYEGTQQTWVDSMPEFGLQVFLDELEYAYPLPVSDNSAAWVPLETELLTPAWDGSEPVADAAAKLTEAVNEKLAQE